MKGFRFAARLKKKKKIARFHHTHISFLKVHFPFPLLVKFLKKVVHTCPYFLISYSTHPSLASVLKSHHILKSSRHFLAHISLTFQCYWIVSQLPWPRSPGISFFPTASIQLPLLTFPLLNLCRFVLRTLSLPLFNSVHSLSIFSIPIFSCLKILKILKSDNSCL